MGLFKKLRLLLKRGRPSATIVAEKKTDASTQVVEQEQDSKTQRDNYTDELESMKTYYEHLILEKDEIIKQLDKLLAAANRSNRATLRSEEKPDVKSGDTKPTETNGKEVPATSQEGSVVEERHRKPTFAEVVARAAKNTHSNGKEVPATRDTAEGRPAWYAQRHLMGPPPEKGVSPMEVARIRRKEKHAKYGNWSLMVMF
jgi:hypothetical protein